MTSLKDLPPLSQDYLVSRPPLKEVYTRPNTAISRRDNDYETPEVPESLVGGPPAWETYEKPETPEKRPETPNFENFNNKVQQEVPVKSAVSCKKVSAIAVGIVLTVLVVAAAIALGVIFGKGSSTDDEDQCSDENCLKPIWSEWSDWTKCSELCGPGIQARRKYCLNGPGCHGVSSQQRTCERVSCDKILTVFDGQWSGWKPWSGCTKSCGGGTQERTRTCTNPPPHNGGDECVGDDTQVRECADWPCPDCSRVCPTGTLHECTYCSCPGTVFYGTVKDLVNLPLSSVNVYHKYDQMSPLTTTDQNGYFKVKDVCMNSQTFYFKKTQYADLEVTPSQVNATHWTTTGKLIHLVKPVLTEQPLSKPRFLGQNVKFCCNATGSPQTMTYEWYKDGRILTGVTSQAGSILIGDLITLDSGDYMCRAVNLAGGTFSREANLQVSSNRFDTCNQTPETDIEALPLGCHTTKNGVKVTTIDVGNCPVTKCIDRNFKSTGKCDDGIKYCCGPETTSKIDIICEDFSYGMMVVSGCGCQDCSDTVVESVVSGRAYGIQDNGTTVDMQYGSLYHNGILLATTSQTGGFSFTVPTNVSNLVVLFIDNYSNTFMATLQKIEYIIGEYIFIEVILPLKHDPINVNSQQDIYLIINSNKPTIGSSSTGDIKLSANSFSYADGTKYTGVLSIQVKYYDPRDINSVKSAPIPFVTEDEEGQITQLETFGFFTIQLTDANGVPLQMNSPIVWNVDVTDMGVPTLENDDPDANLYIINPFTGLWQNIGHFKSSSGNSGRRKRQNNVMTSLTSTFTPPTLGELKLKDIIVTEVIKEAQYYWTNCDRSVQALRYVIKEKRVEPQICYIRASLYKDHTFQSRLLNPSGVRPHFIVVTKQKGTNSYLGYKREYVDSNGFACIPTYCNYKAIVYAQMGAENISYADSHHTPSSFWSNNGEHSSRYKDPFVEVLTTPSDQLINLKTGPIYAQLDVCQRAGSDEWHLRFAPLVTLDELKPISISQSQFTSQRTDWYSYDYSQKPSRAEACFIKIKIITDRHDHRFLGLSSFELNANVNSYGSYITTPRVGRGYKYTKASCVQFKCPGSVFDGYTEIKDVATKVQLILGPNEKLCNFTNVNTKFKNSIGYQTQTNQASFTLAPDQTYGSKYGIYKDYVVKGQDSPYQLSARDKCFSGSDTASNSGVMEPDVGWAMEFSCVESTSGIDLILLIDTSGSFSSSRQNTIDSIKNLVNIYEIGPDFTRVSLMASNTVSPCSNSIIHWNLDSPITSSRTSLLNALNAYNAWGSGCDLSDIMYTDVIGNILDSAGDRPDAPNVVISYGDEYITQFNNLDAAVSALKQKVHSMLAVTTSSGKSNMARVADSVFTFTETLGLKKAVDKAFLG